MQGKRVLGTAAKGERKWSGGENKENMEKTFPFIMNVCVVLGQRAAQQSDLNHLVSTGRKHWTDKRPADGMWDADGGRQIHAIGITVRTKNP